jgi:hypothetical protein
MVVCGSGQTNCGGVCRNTSNDGNNCGVCGKVCPSGQACIAGACSPSCGGTTYFFDGFATNTGWTLGSEWQIGPAKASTGHGYGNPDPATDHTPTADNGIAGMVIGGNTSTAQHGYAYLTSPAIDTSGTLPVILEYWRWLNSDYTPYMQNVVEVWNGASWVVVWQSGGAPGLQDAAWTKMTHDVTAYRNAAFRVRFGMRITSSGAFTVSSWNLDDVRVGVAPSCL